MPALLTWKPIALALLITIQIVSAQDSELSIPNDLLPSSSTQPGDDPLIDSLQLLSLKSPIDAASLLAYNNWGTGDLKQQVPSQHLDETDLLLLASENNHCQRPPVQSQNKWRRKRAQMRRDDAPGKFCGIDNQPNQSGGSMGQQTPTQLRQTPESNTQKPATDEVRVNNPNKPRRRDKIPSNGVEFEETVKNGRIKMGQRDEQLCAKVDSAIRNMPVCHIGYSPLPQDIVIFLPQVRAGELTFLFLDPLISANTNSVHTDQNRLIQSLW